VQFFHFEVSSIEQSGFSVTVSFLAKRPLFPRAYFFLRLLRDFFPGIGYFLLFFFFASSCEISTYFICESLDYADLELGPVNTLEASDLLS